MIPNTSGLQEYTTEELLIELTERAKKQHAIKLAIEQLYDDYLSGRLTSKAIIEKMYDASRA